MISVIVSVTNCSETQRLRSTCSFNEAVIQNTGNISKHR